MKRRWLWNRLQPVVGQLRCNVVGVDHLRGRVPRDLLHLRSRQIHGRHWGDGRISPRAHLGLLLGVSHSRHSDRHHHSHFSQLRRLDHRCRVICNLFNVHVKSRLWKSQFNIQSGPQLRMWREKSVATSPFPPPLDQWKNVCSTVEYNLRTMSSRVGVGFPLFFFLPHDGITF